MLKMSNIVSFSSALNKAILHSCRKFIKMIELYGSATIQVICAYEIHELQILDVHIKVFDFPTPRYEKQLIVQRGGIVTAIWLDT